MTGHPKLFVAPVSFGLGDLVVSLPIVQEAILAGEREGRETWLVSRSPAQAALAARIPALAGAADEDTMAPPLPPDRLVDLRDHPLQTEHWWGTPEFEAAYGPLTINEILRRIGADLGIVADFSVPVPLRSSPRPDVEGLVVFVADADGAAKRWPPARWRSLADALGAHGERAAVVTHHGLAPELAALGLREVAAPTPGDAVDVLTSCRAVVGVDTGLTHLAAQQGTRTVTLCRPPAVYFRAWPHTRVVTGAPCDAVCREAERAYAYQDHVSLRGFHPAPRPCPVESRCLDPILPEHVLGALEALA